MLVHDFRVSPTNPGLHIGYQTVRQDNTYMSPEEFVLDEADDQRIRELSTSFVVVGGANQALDRPHATQRVVRSQALSPDSTAAMMAMLQQLTIQMRSNTQSIQSSRQALEDISARVALLEHNRNHTADDDENDAQMFWR
jgi:hypothetical protein